MAKQPDDSVHGQARILSNTSYLLAASIIQKFISFGYVVFYFRNIGPSDAGLFEPIRSIIPIALIVIDFALAVVLTREIARTPEHIIRYVNTVLSIKVLFAIAALATTLGVTALYDFDQHTRVLLFIAGLVVAFDMFTMTYVATLRGIQIFRYEAIGIVLTQLLTVAVGVTGLKSGLGLPALMIAILAGSIINFTYMLFMVRRKIGVFPRLAWDTAIVKRFLIIALPIVGAQLIAKLFTFADRFLLLSMVGKTATGVYLAAHRIPFSLEFIPAAFAASLLPAMSNYYMHSREQLVRVFERTLRYLLIISIPIAVGMFVLAQPFIVKLFSRLYIDSITPLRIFMLALPLIFLNFPVGSFLIATNRQVWNTINMAVAVAVNIVLNVVLIPRFGTIGSAFAVLASYIVLFTLGLIQVWRVAPLNGQRLTMILFQALLAAGIMALSIGLLQRTFSPYFLVIPGAVLYVAALFVFGTLRYDDVRLLLRIVAPKQSSVDE